MSQQSSIACTILSRKPRITLRKDHNKTRMLEKQLQDVITVVNLHILHGYSLIPIPLFVISVK
jgi:hypothetical protein